MRSRAAVLATLDAVSHRRGQFEDVFFAEHVPRAGGPIAPREHAMAFSVESVFHPAPLGFHAAFRYLPAARMAELLSGISYAEGSGAA